MTDEKTQNLDSAAEASGCHPGEPPTPARRILTAESAHLLADVRSGAQLILATVVIEGDSIIVRVPLGDARLVWPTSAHELPHEQSDNVDARNMH